MKMQVPVDSDSGFDSEVAAFIAAAGALEAEAPTRCRTWTTHYLLAHVVAGGAEIARLVTAALDGHPDPVTVPFAAREPAFRALPYDSLVDLVSSGGVAALLDELAAGAGSVSFTGWEMDAATMRRHVRSELAIHRWDLVGDDEVGHALLARPELCAHAIDALTHFDAIGERVSMRTAALRAAGEASLDVRLRVVGQPDVRIATSGAVTSLQLVEPFGADDDSVFVLGAARRTLMLWGRSVATYDEFADQLGPRVARALRSWLVG